MCALVRVLINYFLPSVCQHPIFVAKVERNRDWQFENSVLCIKWMISMQLDIHLKKDRVFSRTRPHQGLMQINLIVL